MRLRRCQHVVVEPRERLEAKLEFLLADPPRLASTLQWVALAAHLDAEVVLTDACVVALGAISPSQWTDREPLVERHSAPVVDRLVESGLLVAEATRPCADEAGRSSHWRALSAVAHRHSRWHGVDTDAEARTLHALTDQQLADRLGPAPSATMAVPADAAVVALPAVAPTPFDDLLVRRVTCRNFDPTRTPDLQAVASLLFRVFGARAAVDVTGVEILKKAVPSAGGLHPTEAYLLVRTVDGLASGLYHYQPKTHRLHLLCPLARADADDCAARFVAQQRYFAEAPVQVLLVSRFERNFWKYRNHAKAYRATILDVGHLSQTLYLAATELGLAAFITAAVNERDIEDALRLDPMQQGVVAVAGFGFRGRHRAEVELDPLCRAWPEAAPADPQAASREGGDRLV